MKKTPLEHTMAMAEIGESIVEAVRRSGIMNKPRGRKPGKRATKAAKAITTAVVKAKKKGRKRDKKVIEGL